MIAAYPSISPFAGRGRIERYVPGALSGTQYRHPEGLPLSEACGGSHPGAVNDGPGAAQAWAVRLLIVTCGTAAFACQEAKSRRRCPSSRPAACLTSARAAASLGPARAGGESYDEMAESGRLCADRSSRTLVGSGTPGRLECPGWPQQPVDRRLSLPRGQGRKPEAAEIAWRPIGWRRPVPELRRCESSQSGTSACKRPGLFTKA